ncbi:MAG: hypothetical protein ACRCR5_05925, partial [Lactococcus garvieae]
MISRYTFKDLRNINRLSIEELSCKTLIPSETLTEIEIDSSDIEYKTFKILVQFYCISADYVFLGKQSEFEAKQIDEMIQGTTLSKRVSALELVKLEKKLGLNEFSLFQAILELS